MQKGYNYWLPLANESPQTAAEGGGCTISSLCAGSAAKPGNWVLESSLLILLVSCFLCRITVPLRPKLLALISSLSSDQRLLGGDEISHPLLCGFEFLCCCSHLFDKICFQAEHGIS